MSNETVLLAKHNIFTLTLMVVNLFNMFITYGDTFLPTPSSYDELYYEIIRMHQSFDNLYSMVKEQGSKTDRQLWSRERGNWLEIVLRLSTNAGQWKEPASKVTHSLVNIRLTGAVRFSVIDTLICSAINRTMKLPSSS
ncbi:UNVERIFIED_CONTAM: Armadillo-like helical domain-containing protein 3 [Gekko kuhli]